MRRKSKMQRQDSLIKNDMKHKTLSYMKMDTNKNLNDETSAKRRVSVYI